MTEIPSPSPSVGYLGPTGTFTEQAILTQPDLANAHHVLCRSHSDVLFRTQEGELDMGFCAIENAIEGTVNVIQDTLAFDTDLLIQREVVIGITMNLLVRPGTEMGSIKQVISYPHALAQVRTFIRENLPDAETIAANSTADAARLLAEDGDATQAAIGNALAADQYKLEVAAAGIEDHKGNQTRFVLVARDRVPPPSGHDKTSVVVYQRADRPGSLLSILQEFAARAINLTKLESRPTRQGLGDYCFLLDLEGHISDELVADCLRNLHAKHASVKFLGSYPAAGDHGASKRARADAAWSDAEAWVQNLRDKQH
ncbi:MAG: prephenate dehydratase [Acidimicrobiales bacterium]